MKNRKRTVKAILVAVLALAMGVTTLFSGVGETYAAGSAKLNKTSRNILTRHSYDFDVTGVSGDAVITWKSSNEKVATVDQDGVVTGITKGEAKITCTVVDGGETQKLTATVKIRKPAVKIVIRNPITELEYGKQYDLNRKLTPSTSNDVTTWKSSDKSVATVDKNGVVTAKKEGTVTITATTMSGKTDSVTIKVYGGPEATPTPKPTATPKPTDAPKPTQKPQDSKKIELVPLQTEGVTVSGNKATIEPQYLSAIYNIPGSVDGSNIAAVKIVFSSDQQIAIKVKDAAGGDLALDYPNWGVTSMTKTTVNYNLTDGKATQVEFMSLDNKVNIVVESIEFVMKSSGGASEKLPIDLVALQQEGVKVDGNKATIEPQYLSAIYNLPDSIDGSKIASVKVVFSSDQQIAIKVKDTAGGDLALDYPNWGVTSMTRTTVNYTVSGTVSCVEFMSLDNKVNVEVESIEFTYK